jgi:hypothetical protein
MLKEMSDVNGPRLSSEGSGLRRNKQKADHQYNTARGPNLWVVDLCLVAFRRTRPIRKYRVVVSLEWAPGLRAERKGLSKRSDAALGTPRDQSLSLADPTPPQGTLRLGRCDNLSSWERHIPALQQHETVPVKIGNSAAMAALAKTTAARVTNGMRNFFIGCSSCYPGPRIGCEYAHFSILTATKPCDLIKHWWQRRIDAGPANWDFA